MKGSAVTYSIYDILILLVDNDDNFLEESFTLLVNAGFQRIIKAKSCDDAIEICQSAEKPYLIIMEYNFSRMSGPELIRAIKLQCDDIKMIVLSSSDKLADSFKSLESGALSFIHKNDDWAHMLLDSIRTWIDFYKRQELNRRDFKQKLQDLVL
ncbi:MAG: response regulator [Bacteroidetes bacterium]|nr:response regulator [Bacteroidota bacterium]